MALTTTEEKELEHLLGKLQPGFLPYGIFIQIARLTVLPIIEFVPLRSSDDRIEVLLLSRGDDDNIWPNEVHTPGTVIRATDTEGEMYRAFDRVLNDELKGTKTGEPYYVGSNLHKSKRGAEQAQIFWIEVSEEPKIGSFFDSENLPSNLIDSQRNFIRLAVDSYRLNRLSN